ncbi:hypothetical protein [uncultured Dokdonia sp.]|uniref:hypothetical protein n=1 Tax=uncultured Dokdonia sp. TaxID=575653 RepID=UPI00260B8AFB|nr:hypothetical protein [uncultured Dokdonia sp.]
MKKSKEKLQLKKLQISKLQNLNKIQGGGTTIDNCDPGGGTDDPNNGEVEKCVLGSAIIIRQDPENPNH